MNSKYTKFLKQIRFLIYNASRLLLGILLNILIKRNPQILLFSCKTGCTDDTFLHNTKYLFLSNYKNKKYKYIWLTNDKKIIAKLHSIGCKYVYKRNSIAGIYYTLRAKYWFTDFYLSDITCPILSYKAICIDLWHGTGFKRAGCDDHLHQSTKLNKFTNKIYQILKRNEDYYISTSPLQTELFEKVFNTTQNRIKVLGNPRLDVLYKDIDNSNLFLEKDFKNIKKFRDIGKNIILYMPTFRDTGFDISEWLKSEKLNQYLKLNNTVIVCKLHPFDKNNININTVDTIYKMDSNSDIYPILKYSDLLITDYSSIYCDYLLLDKPIIFYPFDYNEYISTCRGFFRPYQEITPGIKVYNEEELLDAISNILKGTDNYKEERKKLRDKLFAYQDGNNCQRIMAFVEELNKKK